MKSNYIGKLRYMYKCTSIMIKFLFTCICYRQYEEKQLRTQQLRSEKSLEFTNQISRLKNQLDYEKKRDTKGT